MTPVDDTFFHVRSNPWYGAGTKLEEAADAHEALVASGLDWEVEKRELYHRDPDEPIGSALGYHEIEDKFAIVRTDTDKALGLVGRNYKEFQNEEAFSFANALLDGGVRFDAAGSYRNQRRVFLVAQIPGDFEVGGVDPYGLYLFLTTSHDGTLALTASVTPVRLQCTNMSALALRKAVTRWKIRHTASAEGQVLKAREALTLTHRAMKAFDREMQALMGVTMSDAEFDAAIEKVLPDSARKEQKLEQLRWTRHESPNLEGHRDTRYGGLQAFTEWLDWGREVRTSEARFAVSFDGYGARQRDAMYRLLSAS